MGADPLESIRYIGQRARAWRHEFNWTGQEAAARLSDRLGRLVVWTELLSYEEGAALPDTATAACLASVYAKQLPQLILPTTPSTPVRQPPWPSRTPSHDDLEAVRGHLRTRGHDPAFAERFFELGVSAGGARSWLSKFDPPAVFEWLAVRFGPTEAEQWASAGHTVEQALQLKEIGLNPRDVLPSSHSRFAERGVANEVTLVWTHLELDEATATTWLDAGWDLLRSLPWVLVDLDCAAATEWSAEGFDSMTARALALELPADEAGRWRRSTIDASAWSSWRDLEFDPATAEGWAAAGFDAPSAMEWSDLAFEPDDAAAFVAVGVSPASATRWRDAGVGSGDVRVWIDGGLDVERVTRWQDVTLDPVEVATYESANLAPRAVKEWLAAGIAGLDIESWRDGGFSPEEASVWVGTSPARAQRLTRRGVSAEADRARRSAGSQRLSEARTLLARKLGARSARRETAASTRSPRPAQGLFVPGCPACGRPIGVNGRCGCS